MEQRIADLTDLAIGPGLGHNRLGEIAVIGDLVLAHIGIGNELKHNRRNLRGIRARAKRTAG